MNANGNVVDCAIVGAGIAGARAAAALSKAGASVLVLERADKAGGRMLTEEIDVSNGVQFAADIGAQLLYGNGSEFSNQLLDWQSNRLVIPWQEACNLPVTVARANNVFSPSQGISSLAVDLLRSADVRCNMMVESVVASGNHYELLVVGGPSFLARSVIVTAPIPQAIPLLLSGNIRLSGTEANMLASVGYQRSFALTRVCAGAGLRSGEQSLRSSFGPLSWLRSKTMVVEGEQYSLIVLHSNAYWSADQWEQPDEQIIEQMAELSSELIDGVPLVTQLHRWRYAVAESALNIPYYQPEQYPGIILAGDSFFPYIHGAYSSGVSAARCALAYLNTAAM